MSFLWVRRLRRYVVLFAVVSAFLIACNNSPTNDSAVQSDAEPLSVGTSAWPAYVGQFVADEKGFFEEEGVNFKEEFFQSASNVNTALLADKVDLAWTGIPDMAVMANQDPSLRLIYVSEYSDGADGIVARGVSSPEDLIGKTIAWEDLPLQVLLLRAYLEGSGVNQEDLNFQIMPAADAAAAFAANRVDVAITYEPFLTAVAIENGGEVIFSSKGTNIIPGGLVGKADVLEARRDDIEAYLRATERGFDYADENPTEAEDIIVEKVEIEADELAPIMDNLKLFRPSEHSSIIFNPEDPLNVMDSINFSVTVGQEIGTVEDSVDASTLYDPSFTAAIQ